MHMFHISGLNRNNYKLSNGNHFEKLAINSWPLVATSANRAAQYILFQHWHCSVCNVRKGKSSQTHHAITFLLRDAKGKLRHCIT